GSLERAADVWLGHRRARDVRQVYPASPISMPGSVDRKYRTVSHAFLRERVRRYHSLSRATDRSREPMQQLTALNDCVPGALGNNEEVGRLIRSFESPVA